MLTGENHVSYSHTLKLPGFRGRFCVSGGLESESGGGDLLCERSEQFCFGGVASFRGGGGTLPLKGPPENPAL